MSAYPTLDHSIASTRAQKAGLQMDQAEDGTLRGRTLYSSSIYEITAVHERINSTDKDSILSHFAAHLGASFSYTWPDGSVAHTVYYTDAPEVRYVEGGRYTVTCHLAGRPT